MPKVISRVIVFGFLFLVLVAVQIFESDTWLGRMISPNCSAQQFQCNPGEPPCNCTCRYDQANCLQNATNNTNICIANITTMAQATYQACAAPYEAAFNDCVDDAWGNWVVCENGAQSIYNNCVQSGGQQSEGICRMQYDFEVSICDGAYNSEFNYCASQLDTGITPCDNTRSLDIMDGTFFCEALGNAEQSSCDSVYAGCLLTCPQ